MPTLSYKKYPFSATFFIKFNTLYSDVHCTPEKVLKFFKVSHKREKKSKAEDSIIFFVPVRSSPCPQLGVAWTQTRPWSNSLHFSCFCSWPYSCPVFCSTPAPGKTLDPTRVLGSSSSKHKQTKCEHSRRNSYRVQLSRQVSLY